MASDISKWADHTTILVNQGLGLLSALQALRQQLEMEGASSPELLFRGGVSDLGVDFRGQLLSPESPSRPQLSKLDILSDAVISGLSKTIQKKFPEQVQLPKQFTQAFADDACKHLKSYYDLFAATAEFLQMSIPVLQLSSQLTKLNNYPEIALLVAKLSGLLVKITMTCEEMPAEKRVIVYVYNRAFMLLSSDQEAPHWHSVVKIVKQNDRPLQMIQEPLSAMSHKIWALLLKFDSHIQDITSNTSKLLANKKSRLADPQYEWFPEHDWYDLIMSAFLLCPPEAFSTQATVDMIKALFEYGPMTYFGRGMTLNIANEMEQIAKLNKISKFKAMDLASAGYTNCFQLHKERREFLVQELGTVVHLYRLGRYTQFLNDLNLIAMAKQEVMWYFCHYDKDITGKKRKKDKMTDLSIVHLMWLIKETCSIMTKYQKSIKKFLFKDIARVLPLVMQTIEALIKEDTIENSAKVMLLQDIQRMLSGDMEEMLQGNTKLGKSLWFNWIRYQTFCSLSNYQTSSKAPPFYSFMSQIICMIRWCEDFGSMIQDHSSLKDLFFFQTVIHEHIKEILEQPSELFKYLEVFGSVASDFGSNCTNFWPQEDGWISSHTMCFTTEVYSLLAQFAVGLAHDLAMANIQNHSQALAVEAVKFLPKVDVGKKNKERKKAVEKPLIRPGTESRFTRDNAITDKMQLGWLIYSLHHRQTVSLGQADFHPFEFFIDALCTKFKIFLNQDVYIVDIKDVVQDDTMSFDVKRPSVYLAEIKAYLSTISFVDHLTAMDCSGILHDTLLDQTNHEQAHRLLSQPDAMPMLIQNKQIREKNKPPVLNTIQPFLVTYTKWYCEFLLTIAHYETAVYSSAHRSFCSRPNASVVAEHYTDASELEALCELIGLTGYQLFEEKITRIMTIHAAYVDESLQEYADILQEVRNSNEPPSNLQNPKYNFYNPLFKLRTIGVLQSFRDLLGLSMRKVFRTAFPTVYPLVNMMHHTVGRSKFKMQPIDTLANQLGIMDQRDGMLHWALSALNRTWLDSRRQNDARQMGHIATVTECVLSLAVSDTTSV
ncbi:Nck-associated protein 1 [Gorgonomyces haynaldii]|nr:Nck-associated protein 1 [Gorgonomyces haynaldii]